VRVIGESGNYDSMAYFGYSALLCLLLLSLQIQTPCLALLGSGSYFLYLWHIFVIMLLRDHSPLPHLGAVVDFLSTYSITVAVSAGALLAVRALAPPSVIRWLGA
jgi:peptidoglycan/LPS O-acetylase OafA/YrhL